MVYAAHPHTLQRAPGNRDNAQMVHRSVFESLSTSDADGCFYLRPDRIVGAFLVDPSRPFHDITEMKGLIADEEKHDAAAREELLEFEQSIVLSVGVDVGSNKGASNLAQRLSHFKGGIRGRNIDPSTSNVKPRLSSFENTEDSSESESGPLRMTENPIRSSSLV
jgi:hypothetical protein